MVPAAPPGGGKDRLSADVPTELACRVRTWAALRGQSVSQVLGEVIAKAAPSAAQLADQMHQIGAGHDHDDH